MIDDKNLISACNSCLESRETVPVSKLAARFADLADRYSKKEVPSDDRFLNGLRAGVELGFFYAIYDLNQAQFSDAQ